MLNKLIQLNNMLIEEMPEYKSYAENVKIDIESQSTLLRSLMNIRAPMQLKEDFLLLQDEWLKHELKQKGKVPINDIEFVKNNQIYLWQGDITRLDVDAIVNAANNKLLGCFIPCHKCIDNAIHYSAGLQLRDECNNIMQAQGFDEPTGTAKITKAYNLPCKFVLHTVGPIIYDTLLTSHCELLKNCYKSCLELAIDNNLKSIAFCCISTGEFRFPNKQAAKIAVQTVKQTLNRKNSDIKVIFNVFKDIDFSIYSKLLQ